MEAINPFSANALSAVLPTFWVSATLTQTAAETLSIQPPVQVEGVASLPTDQLAIQQVALSATSTSARVIGLSSLSLGYANKMIALFPYLQENAALIDNPATPDGSRTDAISAFVAGIDNLLQTIRIDQKQLQPVIDAVATAIQVALPAQVAIQNDLEETQQVLADGSIPALESQLDTIQQAINADNQIIAKGTLHDLVDGVKMAIAIYKMGEKKLKDGLQSLVGAVECMGTTSNAIQQAMTDVNKQIALYVETLEQLTADQFSWAVVQNLSANTDALVHYLTTTNQALQAYDAAWQKQANELQAISASLQEPSSGFSSLTDYLTAENESSWSNLANQAQRQQIVLTTRIVTPSLSTL